MFKMDTVTNCGSSNGELIASEKIGTHHILIQKLQR